MRTDFERAVHDGDAAAVERLLDAGADIDSRDAHGQTALMVAATLGHSTVVRVLVNRGAGLNQSAKFHLTALMLAALRGHEEVVRILVAAGADVSIQGSGAPGFAGKTARDLVEARGNTAVLDAFDPPSASDR